MDKEQVAGSKLHKRPLIYIPLVSRFFILSSLLNFLIYDLYFSV